MQMSVDRPKPARLRTRDKVRADGGQKFTPVSMGDQETLNTSFISSPYLWKYLHLQELWLFGYRTDDISNFLGSIPIAMWPSLRHLLFLLEKKYQPTTFAPQLTVQSTDFGQSKLETTMWEDQNDCGFLQFTFDPSTGERLEITANDFQACFWNMTKHELLSRLENYSMPLFVTSIDFLELFIDDLLNEFQDRERYCRAFSNLSPLSNAVLVHWSIQRRFNSCGQCYLVFIAASSFRLHRAEKQVVAGEASFETCRPRGV